MLARSFPHNPNPSTIATLEGSDIEIAPVTGETGAKWRVCKDYINRTPEPTGPKLRQRFSRLPQIPLIPYFQKKSVFGDF